MSLGFRLKRLDQIVEILRHGVLRCPDAETLIAAFGSVGERIPLPCTQAPHTYHKRMDRPTFDALKRIMERAHPRKSDPEQVRNDWLQVSAWMDEAEHDLHDLDTLGTDELRRTLREIR